MKMRMLLCLCLALPLTPEQTIHANDSKRPLTVEDCVRTRRIVMEEVRLSPHGDKVVYLVKSPDPARNRNIFQLFVRDLGWQEPRSNGRLLFAGERMSGIKWSRDSKHLLFLTTNNDGRSRIMKLDVTTGQNWIIKESSSPITEFTADATADLVVFRTVEKSEKVQLTAEEIARGYPIIFGQARRVEEAAYFAAITTRVFLLKADDKSTAKVSELSLQNGDFVSGPVVNLRNLDLSPDGRFLVFHCRPNRVPQGWSDNVVVRGFLALGQIPSVLALYELQTGHLRLAINAPDPHYRIAWSADSTRFAVNSVAPIGSVWETRSSGSKSFSFKMAVTDTHIFAVDAVTGDVSMVLQTPASEEDLPLSWDARTGPLLVRLDSKTIAEMKSVKNEWKEVSRFRNAREQDTLQYPGMSDGRIEIDTAERASVPPDLNLTELKTGKSVLLTDLNAEYKSIALGDIEKVEWRNKYGADCTGFLIKPVGYKKETLYPLVIMAKGWSDTFFSDTTYRTAFAPQVLANSGFVILMANAPSVDKEPKEYEGQMGEAFNWVEMIESGVAQLSGRSLIDKDRVGIMGFSRTSWLVDFMLTHSKFKFSAASSADGGAYDYSSYWLPNQKTTFAALETQYGGPPYGESFRNWLKYAPAFSAQNVQTPLLIERTRSLIGSEPVGSYEFFIALRRQQKPADLFYYPYGEHELDTPAERIASLQRNVDWFRFWMQGYERPDAQASKQYARWRSLKALNESGQLPVRKPN